MTGRTRVVAVAVLAALTLNGCGGSAAGPAPATSSAPPVDLAASDGCRAPQGTRTDSWPLDGLTMRALVVPAKAGADAGTAVVVSNDSGQTACDWLPALDLLRPYGTLWLYDYVGDGTGLGDTRSVVERALAAGAQRLILVGASKGAMLSLVGAAGRPVEQVLGVVALSPEANLSDGSPVLARIRTSRFPALLLTAAQDPYLAESACRAFAAARPSGITLRVWPGTAHGRNLLSGSTGPEATAAIRTFLDAHR